MSLFSVKLAKQNKKKAPFGQSNTVVFEISERNFCKKEDNESMDEVGEVNNGKLWFVKYNKTIQIIISKKLVQNNNDPIDDNCHVRE